MSVCSDLIELLRWERGWFYLFFSSLIIFASPSTLRRPPGEASGFVLLNVHVYYRLDPVDLLRILLSCVLMLSQMFPTIFKPREIHKFNHRNSLCHLVAGQWHRTPSTKEYTSTRCMCQGHGWSGIINGLLFGFKPRFYDKRFRSCLIDWLIDWETPSGRN